MGTQSVADVGFAENLLVQASHGNRTSFMSVKAPVMTAEPRTCVREDRVYKTGHIYGAML